MRLRQPARRHDSIFKTCLNTLLSMAGLQAGVLLIVSRRGDDESAGLDRPARGAEGRRDPLGPRAAGWSIPRTNGDRLGIDAVEEGGASEVEKCMSCSLHVPMTATGRTRGVIRSELREGRRDPGRRHSAIRSLANQVAVALENAELKRKEERTISRRSPRWRRLWRRATGTPGATHGE